MHLRAEAIAITTKAKTKNQSEISAGLIFGKRRVNRHKIKFRLNTSCQPIVTYFTEGFRLWVSQSNNQNQFFSKNNVA